MLPVLGKVANEPDPAQCRDITTDSILSLFLPDIGRSVISDWSKLLGTARPNSVWPALARLHEILGAGMLRASVGWRGLEGC